jgi:hypothetical protein
MSSVTVRAGDLRADRGVALDMFVRYLNPRYDDARFEWVYLRNPHGEGRLWLATDPRGQTVVGAAGAFPRRMYVGGREEVAWVLGDFCISDRFRSVGPALELQRACLADVAAGVVSFCYDFPSRGMTALYERVGIRPLGRMVRMTRLLRVDAVMSRLAGPSTFSRWASALGNMLLARRLARTSAPAGVTVGLHAGPCGEEFSALARRCASQHGVTVQRSAEYLNWRYLANPVQSHELITARRGTQLAGYAVLAQVGQGGNLVDLFADDETAVVALLGGVIDVGRRRKLNQVSVSLLASHAWARVLRRAGFRERETSAVVVYAPTTAAPPEVMDGRAWLLLYGDRDS